MNIFLNRVSSSLLFAGKYRFGSFYAMTSAFLKAENVSSTIQKAQIISSFLQKLTPAQFKSYEQIAAFISQNKKIGITQKTIKQSFIKEFPEQGKDMQSINEIPRRLGLQSGESPMTLNDIAKKIEYIVQRSGPGSRKDKLQAIFTTVAKLKKEEADIFLRIIAKQLRIGVGKKGLKPELSQSRMNELTEQQKIQRQKSNFQHMLAKPIKEFNDLTTFCEKKKCDILLDLKYDGERTLITFERDAGCITMQSRNGKIQTQMYTNLAQEIYQQLSAIQSLKSIKIDGEIVCVQKQSKSPLPMQVQRARRKKRDSELIPTEQDANRLDLVYGFDVIEINNENLTQKPLIQRRQHIPNTKSIHPSTYRVVKYPEEKEEIVKFFNEVITANYQGLILKGINDLYYTNGTRKHWAKLKKGFNHPQCLSKIDLDLVVMGANIGKGKLAGIPSSYIVGTAYQNKIFPISKVGSGFTQQQLIQLFNQLSSQVAQTKPDEYQIPKSINADIWFKPSMIFEVVCQDFTRSPLYLFGNNKDGGISLRFPVFKQVRRDKNIQTSTDGAQILQMTKGLVMQ